jgi:hypothetical protein
MHAPAAVMSALAEPEFFGDILWRNFSGGIPIEARKAKATAGLGVMPQRRHTVGEYCSQSSLRA